MLSLSTLSSSLSLSSHHISLSLPSPARAASSPLLSSPPSPPRSDRIVESKALRCCCFLSRMGSGSVSPSKVAAALIFSKKKSFFFFFGTICFFRGWLVVCSDHKPSVLRVVNGASLKFPGGPIRRGRGSKCVIWNRCSVAKVTSLTSSEIYMTFSIFLWFFSYFWVRFIGMKKRPLKLSSSTLRLGVLRGLTWTNV